MLPRPDDQRLLSAVLRDRRGSRLERAVKKGVVPTSNPERWSIRSLRYDLLAPVAVKALVGEPVADPGHVGHGCRNHGPRREQGPPLRSKSRVALGIRFTMVVDGRDPRELQTPAQRARVEGDSAFVVPAGIEIPRGLGRSDRRQRALSGGSGLQLN